ncbi:MAG: regulator of cell morphogenesis and NO signaling [Arenicella sp.]|jgi:regulator of cell morphogenesis and NO signaling
MRLFVNSDLWNYTNTLSQIYMPTNSVPDIASMKLLDVVNHNYIYASVLRFFGIDFYKYPSAPLCQICQEKGVNFQMLSKHLQLAHKREVGVEDALVNYEADIVIDYLKDGHSKFIRQQLPYMADLIANISPQFFDNEGLAKDLKFVFPIFAEDFIHHIYEEEATFFKYVARLHDASKGKGNWGRLFFEMLRNSISSYAEHHSEEDDEMAGIRQLTNNYQITESTSVYTKVIYQELQQFERDLKLHAEIENKVLVSKARSLEKKVWARIRQFAKLN